MYTHVKLLGDTKRASELYFKTSTPDDFILSLEKLNIQHEIEEDCKHIMVKIFEKEFIPYSPTGLIYLYKKAAK